MGYDTYEPEAWGWRHEFHAAWAAAADTEKGGRALAPARVTGRERHLYELVCPDFTGRPGFPDALRLTSRIAGASVSGRFEHEAAGPADYPATGDWVLVDPEEGGARIHAALPRRAALSRGMAGDETGEQVLEQEMWWTDFTEKYNAYPALRAIFAKAGRDDLVDAVNEALEFLDQEARDRLGSDPEAPEHDHDGDGVADH